EGTNLHGVWDYWLLQSAGLDVPAYADRLLARPAPQTASAAGEGPRAWAMESCRLIHSESLYPPRHPIADAYPEPPRPLAEQRLRPAAARPAASLEATLAPAR